MDSELQRLVDGFAADMERDHEEEAKKFLNLDRWVGEDPLLLLADAAATTTGISYSRAKANVEGFRDRVRPQLEGIDSLAELSPENDELQEIFPAKRQRDVLAESAAALAGRPEEGLAALQSWAREADPMVYETDPIGSINGVGLRTFQYLRMISGVEAIKPDRQVKKFLFEVAQRCNGLDIDASDPQEINDKEALMLSRDIAEQTEYNLVEIDQIAWWTFSEGVEGV